MRVLLIATTGIGPVDIGGPSIVAQFLAKYLSKHNVQVTILIRGDKNKLSKLKKLSQYQNPNIQLEHIDYGWDNIYHPTKLTRAIIKGYSWYISSLRKFDTIIYNSPPTDILLFFPIIAKLFSKKQIFILHGGIFYEIKSIYGKVGRIILRFYKNLFDYIVCVGPFSVETAAKFRFPTDRIHLIYNGIDFEIIESIRGRPPKDSFKVIYVGRLSKIKRVRDFIFSIHKLSNKYKNVYGVIGGDGPERENLEKLVKTLGLNDIVSFVGLIPPIVETYQFLKSGSIFVLPSEKETFAMVITEAMALGVPTISSDIPGTKHILIDNKNTLLFPMGNTDMLSDKIETLLLNPKLRKKFSVIGRRMVKKRYDWDIIIKKYLTLIRTRSKQEG